MDLEQDNHIENSFDIVSLLNIYFPSDVIPTEISYDYGALSYCQSLFQILQYKINTTQNNQELENTITLIEKNVTSLLSTVSDNLVQQYFPDFYIK